MATAQTLGDDLRALLTLLMVTLTSLSHAEVYVVIVQGLGGEEKFTQRFTEQTGKLRTISETTAGTKQVTVFSGEGATREALLGWFGDKGKNLSADDRLGLFLIGHGSYDGHQYKFNLPGPDLTGDDLIEILDELPVGFQLLVNTSSASGAVLKGLENESRVLITATKSGGERNATRFGAYFISALESSAADVNKNDAISAQEAFDYAERMTKDFYESEGRLATEHPQLRGDRAGQFTLARIRPRIDTTADSELTALLEQKGVLDRRIEGLQLSKDQLAPEDYLDQLQGLLIELSLLQDRIDEIQATE